MWRKTTSFKPVNIFKSFFGLISPNIYTFKKKNHTNYLIIESKNITF